MRSGSYSVFFTQKDTTIDPPKPERPKYVCLVKEKMIRHSYNTFTVYIVLLKTESGPDPNRLGTPRDETINK